MEFHNRDGTSLRHLRRYSDFPFNVDFVDKIGST
jgi:hypothetical protein